MTVDAALRKFRFGFVVGALALAQFPTIAFGDSLTPKIFARMGAGILSNSGTEGGSAFSIGSISAGLNLYPLPTLALGAGYSFSPDVTGGSLPLQGWLTRASYYFMGEGTQVQRDYETTSSTTRAQWSAYTGVELAQRSYFLNKVNNKGVDEPLSGSALAFNFFIGTELRLTKRLDLNVEFNNTFLTFAASDSRYRIAAGLLHVGIGLLF